VVIRFLHSCLLTALCLSLPFHLMADEGFVELDEAVHQSLNEAKTPGQWAALMPEAEAHSYIAADGTQLPLFLFPAASEDDSRPGAVVLFAGGAFRSGNPTGMTAPVEGNRMCIAPISRSSPVSCADTGFSLEFSELLPAHLRA
jgi:hypothetical protein